MLSTDPVAPLALDDHCLVHHFIRTHGRRPDPDELEALVRRATGGVATARSGDGAAGTQRRTGVVAGTLRKELARFVNRW